MKHFCYTAILAFLTLNFSSAAQENELLKRFRTPPQEAKPQVWWHWMNGNISKDGIRKDLVWLSSVGVGGVQIFDAGLSTPQIVPERITYMTPEWQSCYAYAVHVADSLGLQVTMTSTPGWSNTGGPWVRPEKAMKKLVWRELSIVGNGKKQTITLPEGYKVSGSFQNQSASGTSSKVQHYVDTKVIAICKQGSDKTMEELGARVFSSWGDISPAPLEDGDFSTSVTIPASEKGKNQWVCFEFDSPVTLRSLSIADGRTFSAWRVNRPSAVRWLEASDDGKQFRKICNIIHGASALSTVTFPATSAKYFRVVFAQSSRPINLVELELHGTVKVNHSEEKAGFSCPPDLYRYPTPQTDEAVALSSVVDLTDLVDERGVLTWAAPKGEWKIFRFGYSLTGKMNHPASPEATGLEVDKLDADAVREYLEYYIKTYNDATGGLVGADRGISAMLVDSYEAGVNNWTARMLEEFKARRGYDMTPWMPALTGVVMESAEKTDRFLFDYRKTLSELIADSLYGTVTEVSHKYGLQTYLEGHETARPLLADGMQVKSKADIPMGAMWASVPVMNFRDNGENGKQGDIHESASVAHIYGKRFVAAESLTANGQNDDLAYTFSPANLKPVADLELANGLNRFVIHDSAHQPVDNKRPGNGLQIYGQWFHRHETWADEARPWMDYLARSSYMLQQGRYVADILYYYGEDNNVTGLFTNRLPDIPAGSSFDYVNSEALIDAIEFDGKSLTCPGGVRYKVLALAPNATRMTVPVLRKIDQLVSAGAILIGDRPTASLSLNDDKEVFDSLAADIWDKDRDNVFKGMSIDKVLDEIGVMPDFGADNTDSLRFVHRVTDDADIYWVNNRSKADRTVKARFRVAGRKPMIWRPETGAVEPVSYSRIISDSVSPVHTDVTLHFCPGEAFFVVFQGECNELSAQVTEPVLSAMMEISGDWSVEFHPSYESEPFSATFQSLCSLTESSDEQIKYFSGKIVYTNTFQLKKKDLKKGGRIVLDLGKVSEMARVRVNGVDCGLLWKAPYTVDLTSALRKGENRIEIEVTNLWRNRIIGDRQPGCKEPKTYTSFKFYNEKSKLISSGLLGPVRLLSCE